jgi:hypothetical protein
MTCLYRHRGEVDLIVPTHSQPGTRRRWAFNTTLRPLYTRERPRTHFAEGWKISGPVWTTRKVLASPGFEPRTVQHVASRYTDCAVQAGELRIIKTRLRRALNFVFYVLGLRYFPIALLPITFKPF